MVLISGASQFKKEPPVFTRSGWEIPMPDPFDKPLKEDPQLVKVRADELLKKGRDRKIRSVSGYPYSCVGMIFASRRAFIEITHIYDIFHHDGYRQIARQDVVKGDVVLYKLANEPSHVGLVIMAEILGTHIDFVVLSKWGRDAEFFHHAEDVPFYLGSPAEFWTERPEIS